MSTAAPMPEEKSELDEAIDKLFDDLNNHESHSKEYSAIVDQLTKLHKLKDTEAPRRISPDTLAVVIGNIVGIVMILGFERAHVATSKALNFVLKPR